MHDIGTHMLISMYIDYHDASMHTSDDVFGHYR